MSRRGLRALYFSTACVTASVACAAPSVAVAREQAYRFDIPEQDLGTALTTLAQTARRQISFDPAAVRGLRSPALTGEFTARDGIRHLIRNSGLSVEVGRSGVFIVRGPVVAAAASPQTAANSATAALPQAQTPPPPSDAVISEEDVPTDDIVVTGRVQRLYRVDRTSVGKLPTAPLESSQAITTITDQLIEDQGARDAQDLYRNISGVSFYSFAGVAARGFRQEEIFYDGLRGDPNAGFAVPQLFNIERVEFLKGPAGMLYGPGAPGGLFNYVTKKPTDRFGAEVRAIGGTAGRYGGLAEANVPLGSDFAARAGVFLEDRGLQRYNASQRTLIADAGLAFNPGPVRFILQATRYDQRQDAARLRGVPVTASGRFIADREWNANEPEDYLKMRSDAFQGRIEATPIESISLDATLRYNIGSEEQRYHEMNGLLGTGGRAITLSTDVVNAVSVRREYRVQFRNQESWSFGTNGIWSTGITDTIKNRVLIGYDRYTVDERRRASRLRGGTTAVAGLPAPISLANPVYGSNVTASYVTTAAFVPNLVDSKREGFYALDELTLGRLIVTGGVRRDSFSDTVNRVGFSGGDTTYRIGTVYRATDDFSVFGQYATSFEPQSPSSQSAQAGGPFAPSAGDIFEGGIKTALMNGRIQTSTSVYRIKRTNVLQLLPASLGGDGILQTAVGEVASRGFEFDIAVDITPNWLATVNYAYNHIRITEGFTTVAGGLGDNIGDRFANAPANKLGFWTRYQIPTIGIAAALGGDYVSERLSVDGQRVAPYMIFDASLIYETGPLRAMLRVDNLLDKTYATAGFLIRTGHYPGRPRSAFLELRYSFR